MSSGPRRNLAYRSNRKGRIATVFCLFLGIMIPGCAPQTLVAVSDVDAATALLEDSFKSWKSGKTVDDLRLSVPPVYVSEELWEQGCRLNDFSIDRQSEQYGTNVRVHVTLKGTDKKGADFLRTMKYLVTTEPAMTIAREDR